MKRIVLIPIILLTLACNRNMNAGKQKTVQYMYGQTQCNDAWQSVEGSGDTKDNLRRFLESKGLQVQEIVLKDAPAGMMYCEACNCPTGRMFMVSSLDADRKEDQWLALGFSRVNTANK